MRTLFKLITVILSLFIASLLSAQDLRQEVSDDHLSIMANLRPYFSHGGGRESYKLKGYKPIYISHFGRHGSRYLANPKYLNPAYESLSAAKAQGLLTEQGLLLYDALDAIYQEHQGMFGELAPLGAREHRGVASRMYAREKKVFTSKDRTKVRCISSVYTRCVLSMANFTEELSSHAPSLDVSYLVGQKYNDAYMNAHSEYFFKPEAIKIIDSLKVAHLRPEELFSPYVTDIKKWKSISPSNLYEVQMSLYFAWGIAFNLDFLSVDLTRFFPMEHLTACGAIESAYRFATVGVSSEFRQHAKLPGQRLLDDIVAKADDALRTDSDVAADLRFAHDSGLLPMCALLGVEGFPTYSIDEAHKNWNMAEIVPMCANLQMVFYKGKNDILVRIMLNEKVANLPAMTPVHGIYYRWNDIRDHIINLR